jgi:hypothetical protein
MTNSFSEPKVPRDLHGADDHQQLYANNKHSAFTPHPNTSGFFPASRSRAIRCPRGLASWPFCRTASLSKKYSPSPSNEHPTQTDQSSADMRLPDNVHVGCESRNIRRDRERFERCLDQQACHDQRQRPTPTCAAPPQIADHDDRQQHAQAGRATVNVQFGLRQQQTQ